jgi:hypothetical protein
VRMLGALTNAMGNRKILEEVRGGFDEKFL